MENRQLVALSVKSGKIYVGYVISNFNPAFELDSVAIIPMISGYRDKDKKHVVFTTRYIEAYDKIEADITDGVTREAAADPNLSQEALDERIRVELDKELGNFRHVIFVREIESAFIFKIATYERYFRVEGKIATN